DQHNLRAQADPYFAKVMEIVRSDKSNGSIDCHRHIAQDMASVYLSRKDYAQANLYMQEAMEIVRNVPSEREILPGLLHDKSKLLSAQGKFDEAEKCLLEAIQLQKPFAYPFQISLAELYVDMHRVDKAKMVLEEAKSSPYKNWTWLSTYAKVMKAMN